MIDHHVHIGQDSRTGFTLSIERLQSQMALAGVEKSIVFPCPNVKPKTNPYQEANLGVVRGTEGDAKLIPFMFVHPFLDEETYIQDFAPEVQGFKLHQRAEGMDYSYTDLMKSPIIPFLLDIGKPLLFHTGYREGARAKTLSTLIQNTSSPIILAHAGDLIDGDLREVAQYNNVFIEVSPMAAMLELDFFTGAENRAQELEELSATKILKYLEKLFGREKIVWGSDTPWCDNLTPEGYQKEIKIGELMEQKGFCNTYLKNDKKI